MAEHAWDTLYGSAVLENAGSEGRTKPLYLLWRGGRIYVGTEIEQVQSDKQAQLNNFQIRVSALESRQQDEAGEGAGPYIRDRMERAEAEINRLDATTDRESAYLEGLGRRVAALEEWSQTGSCKTRSDAELACRRELAREIVDRLRDRPILYGGDIIAWLESEYCGEGE